LRRKEKGKIDLRRKTEAELKNILQMLFNGLLYLRHCPVLLNPVAADTGPCLRPVQYERITGLA
jgi:hypothetical protein